MQDSLDLDSFLLKPNPPDKAEVDYVKVWLEYKAGTLKDDDGKKVKDPDISDAALDFYKTMWRDFLKATGFDLRPERRGFSQYPEKYVQGDWMCSVATTFKKGLILFVEKNKLVHLFPEGSREVVGGLKTYVPILLNDIDNEKKFQGFWGDSSLQEFIRSAYTFANLIIVPDGFNSARNRPTQDYWDRTLKKYYKDKESLKYKGKDVSTPFQRLLDESKKQDDALCLSPWMIKDYDPDPISFFNPDETERLGKDDNSIPLRDKKLTTLDEWRDLMKEMTDRIDNRRGQMPEWIYEHTKQQH